VAERADEPLHHNERVQKVGGDHVGRERRRPLLEHNRHDVVADVPLPLQLLRVAPAERQQRGHVEHDLLAAAALVHGELARLPAHGVQAGAEALVAAQLDARAQQRQEPVEGGAVRLLVGEELLLGRLARPHVEDAELEVLVVRVAVEVADEAEAGQVRQRVEEFGAQVGLEGARHERRRQLQGVGVLGREASLRLKKKKNLD